MSARDVKCKLGVKGRTRWDKAKNCEYARKMGPDWGCDVCEHWDLPDRDPGPVISVMTSKEYKEARVLMDYGVSRDEALLMVRAKRSGFLPTVEMRKAMDMPPLAFTQKIVLEEDE